MGWLREALEGHLSGECLESFHFGEYGRSFALQVDRKAGEDALFVRFHAQVGEQKSGGRKRCDLLVVAYSPGQPLLVVLVELKGVDTKSALHQIEETCKTLCPRTGRSHPGSAGM